MAVSIFQPLESLSIMELTERLKELSLRLMDMENSDSAAAVEIIKQMDSLKASLQYVC
jgi:hypothetical protein